MTDEDVLAELRTAVRDYESARDRCPPDGRVASDELRAAADRLHDVSARYVAERDRAR